VSSEKLIRKLGRYGVVGIAAGYGLDGPGIESRWGAIFSAPIRIGLGAHPAAYTMRTAGALRGPPSPSSAEVKEREEPCINTPLPLDIHGQF